MTRCRKGADEKLQAGSDPDVTGTRVLRVIISPAKTMNEDPDTLPAEGLPVFLPEAEQILSSLKALSYAEAKALWRCNDKLAELNFRRVREMRLYEGDVPVCSGLTPAVIAYEGIQYRYLSPGTLEEGALRWISEHLRILSGFYGVLRPFDGVMPYRLEMQAGLPVGGCRDLYEFWGDKIGRALRMPSGNALLILNLASKEYAKAVGPYLRPEDRWLSCIFAERKDGRLCQKATLAKMARGEMTRYLAETFSQMEGEETETKKMECEEAGPVCRPSGAMDEKVLLSVLKRFDRLGFSWSEADSTERELVFIHG